MVLKLWAALPIIHEHWGFSGGFDKTGVFYENASGKITIRSWDRCQLPVMHSNNFVDGNELKESKDSERWFLGLYQTYAKRIINGFKQRKTASCLFAVDKEALLNCLLECRAISRKAQVQTKDVLLPQLMRYT